MVDAHVHFWKYNKIKDAWITDKMKMLQRDFLPKHLKPELHGNEMDAIIAVQADQSESETGLLLSFVNENPEIKGIVGWVDLQNENVKERLDYFSKFNAIKGFRHIVQAEPAGFLQNKKFLNGIKAMQNFKFTYDILIYENQLEDAIEFINKFPDQKFILDHCAKPDIKNKNITEWEKSIHEIAKNKNLYCKLSGLTTETQWNNWNEKDFKPYLDVVFDSFGTDRLLFGSDWPVMLLSGNYTNWKNLIEIYMTNFSLGEKQKVFGNNAIKFYNLNS
ncbi:MAG: amidohydrolase family protein [Bacteroidota bacterium]|nr:amidohydrolase family protein [Bacteroidota bacterium]